MKSRFFTRFVTAVLIITLIVCSFALVSCDTKQQEPTEAPSDTVKATEKETEKATEKETEKETEKATEKPTEKATEKPTDKATEKPTDKADEPATVLKYTVAMEPTSDRNEENYGDKILDKGSRDYDKCSNVGGLMASAPATCIKGDTVCDYKFTTPEDGTYVIIIEYVARSGGAQRGMSYKIDEGEFRSQMLTFSGSTNDTHYDLIITVEGLKAGEHTLSLTVPEGFNDGSIKSCDYYKVICYKAK